MIKTTNLRIFHGPVNIAGIGGFLCRYLREMGINADFVVYYDFTFNQNHDVNLKTNERNVFVRQLMALALLWRCLFRYNVFNFYFGKSILPLGLDLPILRLLGKKIVMTYCGTDTRLINDVEKRRNPYFHLLDINKNAPRYDNRKKRMMRWQKLWVHRFIAPRNAYDNVRFIIPEHKIEKELWVHNLGIGRLPADYLTKPVTSNDPPLIVHAPSEKNIKGTRYVVEAIAKLQAAGHNFVYHEVHNLPFEEAMKIYEKADIFIDQLLIGAFGSLAVEGMFFGKPVIGYLIEDVAREHYPDCPIVNSTVDNVYQTLVDLISDKEKRIRLGALGKKFVKRHLDVDDVMPKLIRLYTSL